MTIFKVYRETQFTVSRFIGKLYYGAEWIDILIYNAISSS